MTARWLRFGCCLVTLLLVAGPSSARDEWRGADLSYVNELEDCGAVYRHDGRIADPFRILAAKGANLARFRLWHSPDWTRYSTLPDVAKGIRRARDAGMRVLLDFHYSDDWADPGNQKMPAAWRGAKSDGEVARRLHDYTADTLMALHGQGLLPEYVQVGNELNHGIARLDPHLDSWEQDPERNVLLLNEGIAAVRAVSESTQRPIGVMLHIAQPENAERWFDLAAAAGLLDFDIIGLSYYSQWSWVPLDRLGQVVARLRLKYGKDVVIVETGYPWTLRYQDDAANVLNESASAPGYGLSKAGQRRYLIDQLRAVLGAGGLGIVYWEPAWISSKCRTRWGRGSHWENAALFDYRRAELHEGADFLDHDFSVELTGGPADSEGKDSVEDPDSTGPGKDLRLDKWSFYRFGGDERFDPDRVPDAGWSDVMLPHTARMEPRVVNDQWQGDALYRRDLYAEPQWRGRTVWLRFEGAMGVAKLYLNGEYVFEHKGGYLPFTVDLTGRLEYGGRNRLLVHLDNRDNPDTGPKPLEDLDFNTYGGLYREVSLSVRNSLHITDEILAGRVASGGVFVTYPEVSRQAAKVSVNTHIANRGSETRKFRVEHEMTRGDETVATFVSEERVLATGRSLDHRAIMTVRNPELWSPNSPVLYDLATRVVAGGSTVDIRYTRLGIRHIDVAWDGFRINGERMFLRGVNRHQEYPYVGYAVPPNADYRDAKAIKEAGFDYVRLSHYPHSRHFMRAADELGLVLLNPILGWQYYNPDPAFSDHVVQTCRDLVRRDRNHPSVIAWECSLNESPMPPSLVERLHRAVHEEYPGDQAYSAGWTPDGYDVFIEARQHRLLHPAGPRPQKPYLVSEYGDWEYYAQNAGFNQDAWENLEEAHRTSRQLLAHGETRLLQQATNVQEAHDDNLATPAFGDGYWVMFDYNRGYADDLEASGLMSIERVPKPAWHFFRSQRDAGEVAGGFDGGAMVHIANEWRLGSPRDVRIYSNCEEVELVLNGRILGRKRPDRGRISQHLRHPPFSFDNLRFEPGTLEAVGYIQGREAARHSVSTPGDPVRVEVELATRGVAPAPRDLLFVHARILDAAGVTVPITGRSVRFKAGNRLEILGQTRVSSENGIAATLVRVLDTEGPLSITATLD